jgi:acyl carrier protein
MAGSLGHQDLIPISPAPGSGNDRPGNGRYLHEGERMSEATPTNLDRNGVTAGVHHILKTMTADWDMDYAVLGPDTALIADLTFESIDVVQFIVALEQRFGRRDLPFHELLMIDGRYVDELRVGEVVDFLCRHLVS